MTERDEKQAIEEMAKVIQDVCENHRGIWCTELAKTIYSAGYRKQSENTVDVVRCKDCEYWTEVSFDAITEWHWGECRKPLGDYRDCDTAEHDFCSYGEAKMKGSTE